MMSSTYKVLCILALITKALAGTAAIATLTVMTLKKKTVETMTLL
jgi:hypothetical protein